MTTPGPLTALRGLALFVILVAASTADAGWLIVDDNGDQTLVSRGRLKMAPREGDGRAMVLDLARARMWVADSGRRLYWDGTVEEYCQAVRGSMGMVEQQMAEQLKDLPEAERAQALQTMKQRMGGDPSAPPPRVTIERTPDTETIAGLTARRYRVLNHGKLYEELWLTSDNALVRELELARAPDTFGRMFACLAGSGGARVEATGEYRQVFAQGWPLKAIYYGDGGAAGRALVTRVEPREIPERDFVPPPGFRAAPLDEIFGGKR
jgi:hypothetical protein